jgi:tRNA1Val (adenine37-N6)-methyltransferase
MKIEDPAFEPLVEKDEVFIWNGIGILQRNNVFKVGTDSLLLGNWIPKIIDHPQHILDVGTGTGILALMMTYYFPDALIDAMDNDENALLLARQNFDNSLQVKKLILKNEDPFQAEKKNIHTYDLIVCNPPYYFNQYPAESTINRRAKHAADAISKWVQILLPKLKTSGSLCMVLPFNQSFACIHAANEKGFYCSQRLNIYSVERDELPVRSLIQMKAQVEKPQISNLTIYDQMKRYTSAYLNFSKIQLNSW